METGKLDRIVTLYTQSLSTNEYGEVLPAFTQISTETVWAKVENMGGSENFTGMNVEAVRNRKFTIRYSTRVNGIDEKDRVVYDGETYNILSVINNGERNKELILICNRVLTT